MVDEQRLDVGRVVCEVRLQLEGLVGRTGWRSKEQRELQVLERRCEDLWKEHRYWLRRSNWVRSRGSWTLGWLGRKREVCPSYRVRARHLQAEPSPVFSRQTLIKELLSRETI